ncbi:hypothetical protein M422DRAFT_264615 [Sphaerobolus stellatus SS14]|uniref:Unplaced genomic scaffold SPHSTscaffold_138, whole genome shotgun sequence n=1 Tax=Sphaerobolus stellatus (strain SS14) TaxID=990650 RepID=A0A0C9V7I2_SPHS4|nr:hypothetical protein M422DRAFT_264615 [Sphaerobolus stellatus SS14]
MGILPEVRRLELSSPYAASFAALSSIIPRDIALRLEHLQGVMVTDACIPMLRNMNKLRTLSCCIRVCWPKIQPCLDALVRIQVLEFLEVPKWKKIWPVLAKHRRGISWKIVEVLRSPTIFIPDSKHRLMSMRAKKANNAQRAQKIASILFELKFLQHLVLRKNGLIGTVMLEIGRDQFGKFRKCLDDKEVKRRMLQILYPNGSELDGKL